MRNRIKNKQKHTKYTLTNYDMRKKITKVITTSKKKFNEKGCE